MTALRTWAAVGGIAFLIVAAWCVAERAMAVREDRRDARRYVEQRRRGERP